jgi:transcriptional regulator with XRE-family HTH domain
MQQTFGQRLSSLRLAAQLTQDDFANATKVSRSAVAQWETDRAGMTKLNLFRAAQTLKTTPGYLLTGETLHLNKEENMILALFRSATQTDRKVLLTLARRLAKGSN